MSWPAAVRDAADMMAHEFDALVAQSQFHPGDGRIHVARLRLDDYRARRGPFRRVRAGGRAAAIALAATLSDWLSHHCDPNPTFWGETERRVAELVDAFYAARGTDRQSAATERFWANVARVSSS